MLSSSPWQYLGDLDGREGSKDAMVWHEPERDTILTLVTHHTRQFERAPVTLCSIGNASSHGSIGTLSGALRIFRGSTAWVSSMNDGRRPGLETG